MKSPQSALTQGLTVIACLIFKETAKADQSDYAIFPFSHDVLVTQFLHILTTV